MGLNFVLFLSTTMLAVDWCFIFSCLCSSSTWIKLFLLCGLNQYLHIMQILTGWVCVDVFMRCSVFFTSNESNSHVNICSLSIICIFTFMLGLLEAAWLRACVMGGKNLFSHSTILSYCKLDNTCPTHDRRRAAFLG